MMGANPSTVRRAVVHHALLCLMVLGMLGAGTVLLSREVAMHEAVYESRVRTREMADRIASPLLDASVRSGDDEALGVLGDILEHRMLDGSVTHITLFGEDGRVLWSDDSSIIARQVELGPDVQALFGSRSTIAEEPGDRKPHLWSRQQPGDLIEVYVGAHDSDGVPFVFGAYISPARIDDDRMEIAGLLVPVALGAMALFLLATFPLAISLARRVDRAADQRSEILGRAVAAMQAERQRMARSLHDGVVQDLSAATYALPGVLERLPSDGSIDSSARRTGRHIIEVLQKDLRDLRSMLHHTFLDEPDGGLVTGLGTLRTRLLLLHGVATTLDIDPDLQLAPELETLAFRVVREALSNVGRHAQASECHVALVLVDGGVLVSVMDNGVGLPDADVGPGHFGLGLLGTDVAEAGGHLNVSAGPEGGAVLTAWLPIAARVGEPEHPG
jgi:two-component system, NarL family, sensor kinase